jgi:hypothetical protein
MAGIEPASSGVAVPRLSARPHARVTCDLQLPICDLQVQIKIPIANRKLQIANRKSKVEQHAVQGSNLPLPGLEPGVPPSEPTARVLSESKQCAGKDSNLRRPRGPSVLQADAIAALPPARIDESDSQRGRIRTFNPVHPKHVLCQVALHADL